MKPKYFIIIMCILVVLGATVFFLESYVFPGERTVIESVRDVTVKESSQNN